MLTFSNTARNVALAAVLSAGLAGSAVVALAPVVAHAQDYRDPDDRYYRDWDDRYRADTRYYHRDWDDGWVGIGVPGFGVGFYTNPYPYYCSRYDHYYGYC